MKKQMMIPLIAALVIGGSFAASATIPGSDGIIHTCYRLSDGRLRVVDPAHEGSCAPSERALSWNAHGRVGPRGPKGVIGPRGFRGPVGPRGLRGVIGPRGLKGAKGDTGVTGVKGAPGVVVARIVASFSPATDLSSTASWTQPANTIANVYYRVIVTTPGGSCLSSIAEHVGTLQFSLNASTDLGQDATGADMGPGATQDFPAIGSRSTSALGTLFPGTYNLKTEFTDPPASVPASDCTGTVVQTEVFVETELVS
jgi:Collagen triple helix repeat (20 copies)